MKRRLLPPAPLLTPALCLAAGIAVGAGMQTHWLWLAGAVALTALAGRWPVVQSMGVCLCFAVLGMVIAPDGRASDYRPQTSDFGRTDTTTSRWQGVKAQALQWRGRLLERLPSEGDSDAKAVLAAMTLGDKSALTRELRTTYSMTGASHILALSGLHLGIIYMLLTTLTLGRRRWWLTQVAVVLAIWAFALLTGLSVSVVRAATMLTIYALFALGGRRRAPLGVLSFTAIVMLTVSPASLWDVGFQLSFMSMLAILLFVPLMERPLPARWMMEHRVARWAVGLAAVSIAAQLGTAPLVAFYFHRFATWFLVTNFMVIPLATVILFGAVAAMAVPALGGALLWVVGVLNGALTWMATWPLASVDGLHPSVLQVAMLYVAVGALYVLLATYIPASEECR